MHRTCLILLNEAIKQGENTNTLWPFQEVIVKIHVYREG